MNINTACEVVSREETQVSKQLNELILCIDYLESNIQRLANQLSTVTVLKEEIKNNPCDTPMPPLVPLAAELFTRRSRINVINEELNSLMDRLEL